MKLKIKHILGKSVEFNCIMEGKKFIWKKGHWILYDKNNDKLEIYQPIIVLENGDIYFAHFGESFKIGDKINKNELLGKTRRE